MFKFQKSKKQSHKEATLLPLGWSLYFRIFQTHFTNGSRKAGPRRPRTSSHTKCGHNEQPVAGESSEMAGSDQQQEVFASFRKQISSQKISLFFWNRSKKCAQKSSAPLQRKQGRSGAGAEASPRPLPPRDFAGKARSWLGVSLEEGAQELLREATTRDRQGRTTGAQHRVGLLFHFYFSSFCQIAESIGFLIHKLMVVVVVPVVKVAV